MRLSDVMSHLNLTVYPIVSLLIFLGVFAGVLVRVSGRRGRALRAYAAMALDDGAGRAGAESKGDRGHG
jgi:cbb3-type cytochrome oxidase subunit 3